MRVLALGLGLVLVVACADPLSGSATNILTGKTATVRQVAAGPLGGRVKLFAATSLPELQAMVWASGSTPSFDDCTGEGATAQAMRATCWWNPPLVGSSLLVAATLGQPNCAQTKGLTATLTGAATLQLTVDHAGTCVAGPQNQVGAVLSLLEIPLADLPPLLLEVRVSHLGDPAAAAATEVDLRRPVDESGDPLALTREIRQAYITVSEDAFKRYGTEFLPAGISIRRWPDAAVGCPRQGQTYAQRTVHGYVVRMQMARDPRRVTVEYHGPGGQLTFCSATGPPPPSPAG